MKLRNDRGSVLPLLIFGCFVGLSVIVLVVAATSLYVERKRLFTVADGAALAACESFSVREVNFDGASLRVSLSNAAVQSSVAHYLRDVRTSLVSLRIISASSPDGRSARVTLGAVWHPPIVGELFPLSVPLQVTATARTAYR